MKRHRSRRQKQSLVRPNRPSTTSLRPGTISRTESFARDFKGLPQEIQKRAERTLFLLASDPSHPSLRTKKMQGVKDIWEASVTMSYRITFQRTADSIILRRIGTHDILKRESK